ncbi:MAG: hypothetical protein DID92_2727743802 [Candidatus Nitrotoga sp. SPKER]|nr:MAG: hypothetical protein DID92_2727743802 [Candidatus Nitrotoga sp. SPKER]
MNSSDLLVLLNVNDLTYEATALVAWEIGAVSDMDSVAQFLYKGGPWPPQASVHPPRHIKLSEDDPRPDKKYWDLVKEELTAFLCTDDKKYKVLWTRINALEKKGTSGVVLVVSAYLGEKYGMHASVLAGFVAVFLYGVLKVGKEAYCRLAVAK